MQCKYLEWNTVRFLLTLLVIHKARNGKHKVTLSYLYITQTYTFPQNEFIALFRALRYFADFKINVLSVRKRQSGEGSVTSSIAQAATSIYNTCSNILKPRRTDPSGTVVLIPYTSLNHVTRCGRLPCQALRTAQRPQDSVRVREQ